VTSDAGTLDRAQGVVQPVPARDGLAAVSPAGGTHRSVPIAAVHFAELRRWSRPVGGR
jgi:hypothetical protein